MSQQLDWDKVGRTNRAQRHGTTSDFEATLSYEEAARLDYSPKKRPNPKKQKKAPSSAKSGSKCHVKRAPTRDDRLHNLRTLLRELIAIPNTPRWNKNGAEYQGRLIGHIASTLNALLKLEPSASTEPTSVEANRILAQQSQAQQSPTNIGTK